MKQVNEDASIWSRVIMNGTLNDIVVGFGDLMLLKWNHPK